MTVNADEIRKLGELWATVAEEHNLEKFQTLLSDDFVMWYNFEGLDRTREQFLETLKSAHAMFPDQVNADPRVTVTADGFVLQATMRGTLGGKTISAPYCLVAKVRNGKVWRGEEYFDTAQLGSRPSHGSTEMIRVE